MWFYGYKIHKRSSLRVAVNSSSWSWFAVLSDSCVTRILSFIIFFSLALSLLLPIDMKWSLTKLMKKYFFTKRRWTPFFVFSIHGLTFLQSPDQIHLTCHKTFYREREFSSYGLPFSTVNVRTVSSVITNLWIIL